MTTILAASDDMIPVIAIAGGLLVAIVGIVMGTTRRIVVARQREQSRREIAAYVAEGSMTAEEGERLINAGTKNKC